MAYVNVNGTVAQFTSGGTYQYGDTSTYDSSHNTKPGNGHGGYAKITLVEAVAGSAATVESGGHVSSLGIGTSDSPTDTSATIPAGETVHVTATPDAGYHVQWSASSNVTFADATANSTTFTMPDGAVTVTATGVPNSYTVTLDPGDGSFDDGAMTSAGWTAGSGGTYTKTVTHGDSVQMPGAPATAPTYTATFTAGDGTAAGGSFAGEGSAATATRAASRSFGGWKRTAGASAAETVGAGGSTTVSAATTFTAQWGTATLAWADSPASHASRAGHALAGWYASDADASTAGKGALTLSGDTGYDAAWTANSYTVNLDANADDATAGTPSVAKTYGTPADLPTAGGSDAPTREGYTLAGWDASDAATSATYAAGTLGDDLTEGTGARTLYAVWVPNLTVAVDGDGSALATGSAYALGTHAVPAGTSVTLAAATADDYAYTWTFAGGKTDAPTGASVTFDMPGEPTSVTLSRARARYDVTLDANADDAEDGSTATVEKLVGNQTDCALPTDGATGAPTRTGYALAGWAYRADAAAPDFADGVLTGDDFGGDYDDATLYAVWTALSYNVRLVTGSAAATSAMDVSTTLPDATDPAVARPKRYLVGWAAEPDGTPVVAPGASFGAALKALARIAAAAG